jgi:hypothetical protein
VKMNDRWTSGDVAGFGRAAFEAVPEAERAAWATRLLAICLVKESHPPELGRVVEIGEEPSRWRAGHAAFDAVRRLTIANERSPLSDPKVRSLLEVAETVAKVIYNASGEPAPFDYHAGWRLAPQLKKFAELIGKPELEEELWAALSRRG